MSYVIDYALLGLVGHDQNSVKDITSALIIFSSDSWNCLKYFVVPYFREMGTLELGNSCQNFVSYKTFLFCDRRNSVQIFFWFISVILTIGTCVLGFFVFDFHRNCYMYVVISFESRQIKPRLFT